MKAIYLICLLLFSQNYAQEPVSTPVIVAKLELGKTISIGNVNLYFKEVIEDSRCPLQVTCIWEGEVRIHVEVQREGDNKTNLKKLIFGGNSYGNEEQHALYKSDKLLLYGYRVTPYPDISSLKKDAAYILELYMKN